LGGPLLDPASIFRLPCPEVVCDLRTDGSDDLCFLALRGGKRRSGRVVQRRRVLAKPFAPEVASTMVLVHPELPVAVRVECEPALAYEVLKH
jgi:hypothetical protein